MPPAHLAPHARPLLSFATGNFGHQPHTVQAGITDAHLNLMPTRLSPLLLSLQSPTLCRPPRRPPLRIRPTPPHCLLRTTQQNNILPHCQLIWAPESLHRHPPGLSLACSTYSEATMNTTISICLPHLCFPPLAPLSYVVCHPGLRPPSPLPCLASHASARHAWARFRPLLCLCCGDITLQKSPSHIHIHAWSASSAHVLSWACCIHPGCGPLPPCPLVRFDVPNATVASLVSHC